MDQTECDVDSDHLTVNDIIKLKAFYTKHGLHWWPSQDSLMLWRFFIGSFDTRSCRRYFRLLRRIHYEVNCVVNNQPILDESGLRILDMPYNMKFKEVS